MTAPVSASAAPRRPLPPLTEEHEPLRQEIRTFVAEELRPHADEWEAARWFPDEVFRLMGERGLLGIKYPVEYGGRGGDYLADAVLTEELARCGSGGLAAGIGAVGALKIRCGDDCGTGGICAGSTKGRIPLVSEPAAAAGRVAPR